MASSNKSSSSRHSSSKSGSNRSNSIDCSLPVRTAVTPVSKRPSPSTLRSNQSAASSSSSSSEGSASVFDHDQFATRAESPTTPEDDVITILGDTVVLSQQNDLEGSPLLKVHRRPKRPSTASDGDYTRRLPINRKLPPRTTDSRSTPPPRLQPFISTDTITQPQSSSLNFQETASTLPQPQADIFKDESIVAKPSFKDKELREPETIEISDDESDEQVSSAKENQFVDPGNSPLESEDEQQFDIDQSEDEDAIPGVISEDVETSEHDLIAVSPESGRVKFTRYREKDKDSCFINESIVEIMKSDRKPKISPGWTYIFESPNRPGHLKIGSTIRMHERERSLKRCDPDLILVMDDDRDAFDYHSIVESLVHQELHNKRRVLACDCGAKHQEWFEVTKEDALRSVRRWRTWIKMQKPYDAEWKLTPYWQWRARKSAKTFSDVDWDIWIEPSLFNYLLFCYHDFGKRHFERKDRHFLVVGMILLFCMYVLYGQTCSVLIFVGLILI